MQSLQLTHVVSHSMEAHDHVIVAGFGRSGKALARLLKEQQVPYMGIDIDPENVQRGILKGHDVVYGDITRKESLLAAGVQRARALVITYIEPRTALHVLHHVRELNPNLPVIVRTLDDSYLEQLQNAGAVAVVPEILEGSLILATQTLLSAGATPQDVLAFIAEQRRERYDLLRQHFDEESDPFGVSSATPQAVAKKSKPDITQTDALSEQTTRLSDESLWTDQAISALPLMAWRVSVKHVIRGLNELDLSLDPVLHEGDEIRFVGQADDVRRAAQALNGEI